MWERTGGEIVCRGRSWWVMVRRVTGGSEREGRGVDDEDAGRREIGGRRVATGYVIAKGIRCVRQAVLLAVETAVVTVIVSVVNWLCLG